MSQTMHAVLTKAQGGDINQVIAGIEPPKSGPFYSKVNSFDRGPFRTIQR